MNEKNPSRFRKGIMWMVSCMINKLISISGVIYLTLFVSNCVTTEEHFRHHGLNRASFDLECPKEKIQIQVLGEMSGGNGQVGVIGCNKKAIYVAIQGAGWVNNTASNAPKR
ncbi:hypothetical protein [Leptospira yasudae]|nr:hypothetical protein [Leptospira yasudae]